MLLFGDNDKTETIGYGKPLWFHKSRPILATLDCHPESIRYHQRHDQLVASTCDLPYPPERNVVSCKGGWIQP